jgi:hypothetical protein
MIGSAFIRGEEIHLRFEWMTTGRIEKAEYLLGAPLMDFIWLPPEVSGGLFGQLQKLYLLYAKNGEGYDQTIQSFQPFVLEALEKNIYLYFYTLVYMDVLLHGRIRSKEALERLKLFLTDKGEGLEMDDISFSDATILSEWGKAVLLEDMQTRQKLLKSDLDDITGEGERLQDFTPMQRLFLLSVEGRNYLTGTFKTTVTPDYAFDEDADMDDMKATLKQGNVDIVEMTDIDTLDDLIRFELFHTLRANQPIKKCKYCGEYFIPHGRTDTEYCNRIKWGETKRCSEIGAVRNYWDSKTGDPVYTEFQRAYKRNHSRVKYKTMTQQEFYDWSEEARKKREECAAGKLSLDAFREWLGNRG